MSPADRLQPGIYFRSGERAPPSWRMLLLDFVPGTDRRAAHDAMAAVTQMLAGLKRGKVRELEGQPAAAVKATRQTFEDLAALVGFGRPLFDEARHDPPLASHPRPAYLSYLPREGDAFPALPWAAGATPGTGEADVALQLTAAVQAAVDRAAVEVWKLIEDEGLPLVPRASYDGFGRPDGRGWLEFHDGVGNVMPSRRLAAIAATGAPKWMAGGTYMAFMRFRVSLGRWRTLDRGDQELVVGRDKLTGAPLVGVRRDRSGRARPVAAAYGRKRDQAAAFADPPQSTDPLVESSHVHRSNQNRASPDAPAGLRIFRQGYDFLDGVGPDGPLAGLNFVSFQADLGTLHHLLHLPGWLGNVNFGGPTDPGRGDPPAPELISLLAGGLYAAPPRGRPFPGAALFG